MSENEKLNLLSQFIIKIKRLDNLELTLSTKLADLSLDSLDIVELQMMYEDSTGKQTVDPAEPILTVKNLLKLMP
jgi:acyl carrier protein